MDNTKSHIQNLCIYFITHSIQIQSYSSNVNTPLSSLTPVIISISQNITLLVMVNWAINDNMATAVYWKNEDRKGEMATATVMKFQICACAITVL